MSEEKSWAVKVECVVMSTGTLRFPAKEWRWIDYVDTADPTPKWWRRRLFDLATAVDVADAWKAEGVRVRVVPVGRRVVRRDVKPETVTLEHHLATVAMVRAAATEQAASLVQGCASAWAEGAADEPDARFSANEVATKLEAIAKAVALLKVWPW